MGLLNTYLPLTVIVFVINAKWFTYVRSNVFIINLENQAAAGYSPPAVHPTSTQYHTIWGSKQHPRLSGLRIVTLSDCLTRSIRAGRRVETASPWRHGINSQRAHEEQRVRGGCRRHLG